MVDGFVPRLLMMGVECVWCVWVWVCVYGLKGGWTGNCVCGLNDWTISSRVETWVGLQECPLPNTIFPASLLASGWSPDCYTNWIVATSWGLFGIDNTGICGYRYLWMEREKENPEGQMLLWDSLHHMLSLGKPSFLSLTICLWLLRCFFPRQIFI